jgi:hypothetical protein
MTTIYLHIGTEKTGTTTLQDVAAKNRIMLANRGLLYPKFPGVLRHHGLTVYALPLGRRDVPHKMLRLPSDHSVDRYRYSFIDKLGEEIHASKCGKVLLSNEHLSSWLKDPEYVDRLVTNLRSIADEIRVIVYLRPQYELVVSFYSTAVKAGSPAPIRLDRTEEDFRFNYERMLNAWEAAAGAENMHVRLFSKDKFHGGSLIADFFNVLGVDLPARMRAGRVRNRSLDTEAVEYLRLVNEHLEGESGAARSAARRRIMLALDQISSGGGVTADPEKLAQFDNAFAESNGRIADRYFPEAGGQLFPPFKDPGVHTTTALDPARIMKISLAIMDKIAPAPPESPEDDEGEDAEPEDPTPPRRRQRAAAAQAV